MKSNILTEEIWKEIVRNIYLIEIKDIKHNNNNKKAIFERKFLHLQKIRLVSIDFRNRLCLPYFVQKVNETENMEDYFKNSLKLNLIIRKVLIYNTESIKNYFSIDLFNIHNLKSEPILHTLNFIHFIFCRWYPRVIKYLLKHSYLIKSLDIVFNNKNTPLHYSCKYNDLQITKTLSKISNINQQDLDNWSPLHVACRYYQIKTIEFLLEQPSIDINSQDKDGFTPLHIACIRMHLDVIVLLLNCKNINIHIKTQHEKTAFDFLDKFSIGCEFLKNKFPHIFL